MDVNKAQYTALVLGGGSMALVSIMYFGMVMPLQAKVTEQANQIATLSQTAVIEQANQARISELDLGLAAVVKVAGMDHDQLRGAMILLQQGQEEQKADSAAEPALTIDSGAAPDEEAPLEITGSAGNVKPSLPVLSIQDVDSVLAKRIADKWFKPAGAGADLSAIVKLSFDRKGHLKGSTMTKPSGDARFDESIAGAIKVIGDIPEVAQLSDEDYEKAYAGRTIQFTPNMGR